MGPILEKVFIEVLNMGLTASVMIAGVFIVRLLLKKAPKIYSYVLWSIVLFRLLCPVSFETEVSLLGALQNETSIDGRMEYIPQDIGYQLQPEVQMPIEAVNEVVNDSLPQGDFGDSVNPLQTWLYFGVRVWILGIAVMLVHSGLSLKKLRKQMKLAVCEDKNIYRMPGKQSPFVYGVFKPRIYIPDHLEETEREYVLLHEQVHIRRGDHIYRLLAYLAVCVHWFNPLVWAAFFFSGRDMEISCDEAVIRKMGSGVKKEYSASLLNLACGEKIVKGIPVAFGESDTKSRIKHVLKYKKPAKILSVFAVVLCVIAAILFIGNPKKNEISFYGVVTYADTEDTPQMVINSPRTGHVLIPDVTGKITYYEENLWDELEEGDLIELTFSKDNFSIMEISPAAFSQSANTMVIKGKGFAMNRDGNNMFSFALPEGLVPGAGISDTIEFYRTIDVQNDEASKAAPFAIKAVTDVDQENNQIWIQFTMDEVETFLENYPSGIYCNLIAKENSYEESSLVAQDVLNPENPMDGIYNVSIRNIDIDNRCIDYYVSENMDEEQPKLYFAENCDYFINWQWDFVNYEEVTFLEFANVVNDKGTPNMNVNCVLTFQNGLITKAELPNGLFKYGIFMQVLTYYDYWYEYVTKTIKEEQGVDGLATYYTLADTITADISAFIEGEETVEIYAGNIGDGGDSGLVLVKNAQGEVIHTESAHHARAGWNNIYLVNENGKNYILTVHIEDRDTFGSYGYQVYEIGPMGMLMNRTGTRFEIGEPYVYDDEMFKHWVRGLEYYLENSVLLLSTQEGELRTERVSDLDRYNYETLKRE